MKKWIIPILVIIMLMPPVQADCDCSTISHSYFSVQPHYQSATPERVSNFHDAMIYDNNRRSTVQLALFGGTSVNNRHIAEFFSPMCSDTLIVKTGVNAQGIIEGNIDGQHFNIDTNTGTFRSVVSIKPHHSTFGIGATYRNYFEKENGKKHWWLELSSPLTLVQHRIELIENITDNGAGALTVTDLAPQQNTFDSIIPAFNQSAWKFGKIDSGKNMHIWRLADIECKVGFTAQHTDDCAFDPYVGIVIPTGNKPKAEFVFEPVVGNGRHVGIMFGLPAQISLYSSDSCNINAYMEINGKYLFSRKERRSFDLKFKPWSRYQEMYINFEQAQLANSLIITNPNAATLLASPGINLLTQDAQVKPGFLATINMALTTQSNYWSAECGYNLFFRQSDCVSLDCFFPETAALKSRLGGGETNPLRTISQPLDANDLAFGQTNFNNSIIKASDIDLNSAAHPCYVSHTVYGSIGRDVEAFCNPVHVSVGASYEFGKGNQVLNQWLAWGKIDVSF